MSSTIVITEDEILAEIAKLDEEQARSIEADPDFWWVNWVENVHGDEYAMVHKPKDREWPVQVWFSTKRVGDEVSFMVTVVALARFGGEWHAPSEIRFQVELCNGGDEKRARRQALRYGRWMVDLMKHAPSPKGFKR